MPEISVCMRHGDVWFGSILCRRIFCEVLKRGRISIYVILSTKMMALKRVAIDNKRVKMQGKTGEFEFWLLCHVGVEFVCNVDSNLKLCNIVLLFSPKQKWQISFLSSRLCLQSVGVVAVADFMRLILFLFVSFLRIMALKRISYLSDFWIHTDGPTVSALP